MHIVSSDLLYYSAMYLSKISQTDSKDSMNFMYDGSTKKSTKELIELCRDCKWINITPEGIVSLTEHGKHYSEMFKREFASELARSMLLDYSINCQPVWVKKTVHGYDEAIFCMTPNEQQCFASAGLLDLKSPIAIRWWDKLASLIREEKDENLSKTGRIGEWYTMSFEQKRVDIEPEWTSLVSDMFGFDVKSQ